jgi:hypothetical protein
MSDSQTTTTRQLIAITLILAFVSLIFRIIVTQGLEQSSALFIGVPALLAILLAITPQPSSAMGVALKATTLALLLSGVLFGEGFVCILMAAPLFYGVVIAVVAAGEWGRRRGESRLGCCVALLPLLPMSMEGVTPVLSLARDELVVIERTLPIPASELEAALARPPRLDLELPAYLRLGFPRPVAASGDGLDVGDRRSIRFEGGEGKPGNLELEVAERTPGRVRFDFVDDTSHISHWLTWQSATLRWAALENGTTRVRFAIAFRRDLDPAWYFGPWQRYAVSLAGEYLIDGFSRSAL